MLSCFSLCVGHSGKPTLRAAVSPARAVLHRPSLPALLTRVLCDDLFSVNVSCFFFPNFFFSSQFLVSQDIHPEVTELGARVSFSDKMVAHLVSTQTLQVDQSGNSTQVKKNKKSLLKTQKCVWPTLSTFLVVVVFTECVFVPFLSLALVFFSLS